MIDRISNAMVRTTTLIRTGAQLIEQRLATAECDWCGDDLADDDAVEGMHRACRAAMERAA